MRYSVVFASAFFAAAAFAQSEESEATGAGNPFTVFLSQTNSLSVVTGQPAPVTTQPEAVTTQPTAETSPAGTPSTILEPVTSQPEAVTSQPSAETSPAGALSTAFVPVIGTAASVGSGAVPTGIVGTGSGRPSTNGTFSTGSPTPTEEDTTPSETSGDSSEASSTDGSTSSSQPSNAAGLLEPVIGLGFAGALFAALL